MPVAYTHRRPKIKRYVDLPRSKRLDCFVSRRTAIASDRDGRGVFSAYHYLQGMDNPENAFSDFGSMHFECSFLSRTHANKGWVYYADIECLRSAAFSHLSCHVHEQVEQQLFGVGLSWSDALGEVDFGNNSIVFHPDPALEQFDGRTISDLKHEQWQRVNPQMCHHLQEGYSINTKHRHGVGLTALVFEPLLTVSNVINTIERFHQLDEQSVHFQADWDNIDPWLDSKIATQIQHLRP